MLKKIILLSSLGISLSLHCDTFNKEDIGNITVQDKSEESILTHSPMAVSVIEMEKFHGRNISLNEVLKRVAGVKIRQEGGFGSKSTIAIHGLEGKRVKIFIDGKALNSPDGSFGINDIPVQLIERIEIYKGVVPAKFGGDALGGAVNIVTKEFEDSYIDLTYSSGSYNTHRVAFVFKKKFEEQNIELGVGGFYNKADNDYVMDSPYVKGLKIKRDHDKYTSMIYSANMSIKERWFDEIELEVVHYESEKEIQGIQSAIKEAKTKSSTNIFILNLEKNHFLLDNLLFEYNFMSPHTTSNYIDKATTCYNFNGTKKSCGGIGGEINGIPHDSKDTQKELRHDLNLHYLINTNNGINFHVNSQYSKFEPHDDITSEILGYDIGAFPSEKTNTVYSLGYESALLDGKLINDIGIKSYHYDYKITSQKRAITSTPVQNHNSGNEMGYYESIRYEPIKDLFVKASYEHAYRLPDSPEIFGDGILITSAPNLLPEEADNFNLGVLFEKYDFYTLPWCKAEVNLFYRYMKNMIKKEYGVQALGYVNLGEVEVKGFEVELQADLNEYWYLYINYTNQSLQDKQKILQGTKTVPNPTYGLDIPNIASQYGNLGLEYKTLGFLRDDSLLKLFWEMNWADSYYFGWKLSRRQEREVDAQLTHTTGFEYSFKDDSYSVGFEVRNLTDKEVTDVYNYPLMGITYHLNFRYNWF